MTENNERILLDVAKLIRDHNITIGEFYTAIGCEFENVADMASDEVSKLAGIFIGWQND
ncbi:hypothetical protein [Paramylibacter kogurei]|uniref:hypothetical protein n=1 Tax=Paramylibacter kogurei TaxID=1889778 RepID=UPI0013FD7683|nr:hypothetical protein [Amylibacter kogurei]